MWSLLAVTVALSCDEPASPSAGEEGGAVRGQACASSDDCAVELNCVGGACWGGCAGPVTCDAPLPCQLVPVPAGGFCVLITEWDGGDFPQAEPPADGALQSPSQPPSQPPTQPATQPATQPPTQPPTAAPVEETDCARILSCSMTCGGDVTCLEACFDAAPRRSQGLFLDLQACSQRVGCGGRDECIAACPAEAAACGVVAGP